jgi:hypothetical protein
MIGGVPKTDFAENLNTVFRATRDEIVFEMELIEVLDRKSTPKQEQFSLFFRAPLDVPAEQGVFHIEHNVLPSGELFLVPVSGDERGLVFQAVFNRLID